MRQILVNLAGNALKFTASGHVVVTAACLGSSATDAELRLTVRDTGAGIRADIVPLLFQSFSQGDSSTTRKVVGTGLGLAITRRLAEAMGGTAGVESVEGSGSTLWVTLRLATAAAVPAPLERASRGAAVVIEHDAERGAMVEEVLATVGVAGARAPSLDGFAAAEASLFPRAVETVVVGGRASADALEQMAHSLRATHPGVTTLVALVPLADRAHAARLRAAGYTSVLTLPLRPSYLASAVVPLADRDVGVHRATPVDVDQPLVEPTAVRRVLVVEDNVVNQMVCSGMLRKMGCIVEIAPDGAVAVGRVAHGAFDVVLMDCMMPTPAGYDATRAIRAREAADGLPRLPIIALTASARREDRQRALDAGMDDHVAKPIDLHELREAIEHWSPVVAGREEDPLDEAVLLRLRETYGEGGDEFVQALVDLFVLDAPDRIVALRTAARNRDADAVARGAHALFGSASTLGAQALARHARELDAAAQGGESSLEARVERLALEVDVLRERLRSVVPPPPEDF